ncbi:hypothetical protein OUZ56_026059 [Daphnia magna]|uniref:Uncharacterized protein n=1 Tax=Daphnia magna TaxID=35525 RepID=A0ABQ9ZKP4_9CRUS|nr:hypothetical protein OUZ56_026059 [Daphnia magna]
MDLRVYIFELHQFQYEAEADRFEDFLRLWRTELAPPYFITASNGSYTYINYFDAVLHSKVNTHINSIS